MKSRSQTKNRNHGKKVEILPTKLMATKIIDFNIYRSKNEEKEWTLQYRTSKRTYYGPGERCWLDNKSTRFRKWQLMLIYIVFPFHWLYSPLGPWLLIFSVS
jgi:hypothetical protein